VPVAAPSDERGHGTATPPAGGIRTVEIYDTTLRDGAQREGLSLTVNDKLRIAEQLDYLGVHYIEGGHPGGNPKDSEFFARARDELDLQTAELVAFGATRRAGVKAEDDEGLMTVLKAGTRIVCLVGKAWDYHVTDALQVTLEEGVAIVRDSVRLINDMGLRGFYDAEHFFDGYRRNPSYSLEVITAALEVGADRIILCDTNGGTLPDAAERIVREVREALPDATIGVHFHNDSGCAVANSLAGVRAGAFQVQGCMNGFGERCGNADLTAIIPNLVLKMGVDCIDVERLVRLTPVAHHIAEVANVSLNPQNPYVGDSAFATKAGIHTSALARRPDAYEHIVPETVGNGTRIMVSELSGRSTVLLKARQTGIDLESRPEAVAEILRQVKELEHAGYHFEAADGSYELLVRRATGWQQDYFRLESFRVIMEDRAEQGSVTEATVKVHVRGERRLATAEGNGPVNALDRALRSAIEELYPALAHVHLTDYKVRVLDTERGTGAITRVLIDSTDGETSWSTIGVSENIIDASWQALADSIVIGLLRADST
jgi:2-isopropylmalate synthase